MSDPRIEGYARGLFEIARAEGTLDEVEDELFRFARSYESSDVLRNAQRLSGQRRNTNFSATCMTRLTEKHKQRRLSPARSSPQTWALWPN